MPVPPNKRINSIVIRTKWNFTGFFSFCKFLYDNLVEKNLSKNIKLIKRSEILWIWIKKKTDSYTLYNIDTCRIAMYVKGEVIGLYGKLRWQIIAWHPLKSSISLIHVYSYLTSACIVFHYVFWRERGGGIWTYSIVYIHIQKVWTQVRSTYEVLTLNTTVTIPNTMIRKYDSYIDNSNNEINIHAIIDICK